MGELDRIRERYDRREASDVDRVHDTFFTYDFLADAERDLRFAEIVRRRFADPASLRVLEVGAGKGNNLLLFRRLGVPWENLYANELIEGLADQARYNLPGATILTGDASELPFREFFDVVVQSTVFTSILDDAFKRKLARKMLDLLTEVGIVLWYDFTFDNPRNPDVKGIGKGEIRRLFEGASSFEFHRATLAPPIGRRLQRSYGVLNTAPFLRTHLVAAIGAAAS